MIELVEKKRDLLVDVKELVKGDKGDKGDRGLDGERGPRGFSGVHIGDEAPTDDSVVVWIKPDGGGEELVAAEGGAF